MEEVLRLSPQVVIDVGERKKGMQEDLDKIQSQLGIPVIHIDASTATMEQAYEKLGSLLGKETEAKALGRYCAEVLERTKSITAAGKVKGIYVVGEKGINVLAKGSYQGECVDMRPHRLALLFCLGICFSLSTLSFAADNAKSLANVEQDIIAGKKSLDDLMASYEKFENSRQRDIDSFRAKSVDAFGRKQFEVSKEYDRQVAELEKLSLSQGARDALVSRIMSTAGISSCSSPLTSIVQAERGRESVRATGKWW